MRKINNENKPMTVGDRLRKYRRDVLGLSQKEVVERVQALTGNDKCSQQTIGDIESGKTRNSKFLPYIALALNVSLEYLNPDLKGLNIRKANDYGSYPLHPDEIDEEEFFYKETATKDTTNTKNNEIIRNNPITYLEQDVPIFETIDLTDDGFLITDTPIDYITRPHMIKLETDAFGIIIRCRTLEPAIRIGNTILLHPRKPVQEGNYCLFFNEINKSYTIGEYIKEDATGWSIKKYNPQQETYLEKKQWKKCYVIVAIFL